MVTAKSASLRPAPLAKLLMNGTQGLPVKDTNFLPASSLKVLGPVAASTMTARSPRRAKPAMPTTGSPFSRASAIGPSCTAATSILPAPTSWMPGRVPVPSSMVTSRPCSANQPLLLARCSAAWMPHGVKSSLTVIFSGACALAPGAATDNAAARATDNKVLNKPDPVRFIATPH